MRILAFDQATLKTGYALFDGEDMVEHGVLKVKRKDYVSTDLRCRAMALAIDEMIRERHPDLVVIEDVVLQKNPKVLIQLSRIQGEIIGYCDMMDMPIEIMSTSTWRTALGFRPNQPRIDLKAEAQQFVLDTFDLFVTDDEADAICMAYVVWKDHQNNIEEESEHE